MYIDVDLTDPTRGPLLAEAEDFARFKVVIHGPRDMDRARDVLATIGELLDAERCRIGVDAVGRMAQPYSHDPGWRESFDAMLGYADSKGWLDAERGTIAAHCEWADE